MNPSFGAVSRVPPRGDVISRHGLRPCVTVKTFIGGCLPKNRREVDRVVCQEGGLAALGAWTALGIAAASSIVPGQLLDETGRPMPDHQLAAIVGTSTIDLNCALEILRGVGAVEDRPFDGRLVTVAAFIRARCVRTADAGIPRKRLWQEYLAWCRTGENCPLTTRQFCSAIQDLGLREGRSRRISGKQVRTWEGIGFRSDLFFEVTQ
jgi:hypothetical protein